MHICPALVEEALMRRLPFLARLLPKSAPGLRDSLPRRLAAFRRNLASAITAQGSAAVDSASALAFHAPGAIPTVPLLHWKLSAPDPRYELLALEIDGKPCAAFFTASTRGHRGQVATLNVSAIWGPAWDADPAAVLTQLVRAARPEFPFLSLGFSPVPESLRPRLRLRKLDAPRRWMARSAAQPPPLSGWNGLDAL